MRLLRLEIKGFKSFARETVLHFDEDVIGVVGPNGSGKSNIVDAIRWVLGEQKRGELRLDKMSSVIFNGTKSRKPGNVAQVFITFANDRGVLKSEFATVTVGRLLYRNGDSEYRLNGVTCRRKDITQLFADTGVESDSYAIIALGMVDDILADKDNSRLRMLEQAAGIGVYKARKRETLQRLTRTLEDLERVEDLLSEIDRNLRALDRQAKRARQHEALRHSYREKSVRLAAIEGAAARAAAERIAGELARAVALGEEYRAALAAHDAELARLGDESAALEPFLAEARARLSSVSGSLRKALSDRQLLEQKLHYRSEQTRNAAAEVARLRGEVEKLTARVAELDRERGDSERQLLQTEEEFLSLEREYARSRDAVREVRGAHRESVRRHGDLQRVEFELVREVGEAQRAQQRLDQERSDLEHALAQQATRLSQLTSEVATVEREEEAATHALEEALRAEDEWRERREGIRQLHYAAREGAAEAARALREAEHALDLHRRDYRELAGSSEGTKLLAGELGWRDRYSLLGELIDVETPHRDEVAAALGPLLGSFVVPSWEIAREGVALLASRRQAGTTILVADASETSEGEGPVVASATSVGRPAAEVIDAGVGILPLIRTLLRGVVLLGDGDPDLGRFAGEREGLRYVTSRPVALYGVHGVTIGVGDESAASPVGLKRKLTLAEADLSAKRDAATAAAAEVLRVDAALSELGTPPDAARRADLQRALAELRGRSTVLRDRTTDLSDAGERARERIDRLGSEEVAAGERLSLAQSRLADHRARFEREALRRDALEQQLNATAEAFEQLTADYNAANLAQVRERNTVDALAREHRFAAGLLQDTREALGKHLRTVEGGDDEVGALQAELASLAARITDGESARAAHETELEKRERGVTALRTQRQRLDRERAEAQRNAERQVDMVAELREKRQERQYDLRVLDERLRIEFGVSLNGLSSDGVDVTDAGATELAGLSAELVALRGKLEGFGEVNALAVEAYDAMAERHADITQQRDDILAATEALRGTVAEIDGTAAERLTATFEDVRAHFTDVFRHLFDAEDTADMVMLDPDNPLESKIEIVAKPQGKRPQAISQLSGGEKTLTATAFLFALYLVKPAPFCIFDEVDAPLDDVNVEKFNRIVKRFSGESQFIIVTHNKLSMAAVDTIYGVFMPELGVSSVAPVDFRSFAHAGVDELVGGAAT